MPWTNAEKVVVFDHTLRDSAKESRANPALREPVQGVHNDQTRVSAPRRVRDHLPLAMCDARSIAPADLVPSDLVCRDKVGETYSFRYNPEHRWYWFPRLRSDEPRALVFWPAPDTASR